MATKPSYTTAQIVNAITTSWGGQLTGKTFGWDLTNITYSINVLGHETSSNERSGAVGMTATMISRAQLGFELWDDLIAITLNESPANANANITFSYSTVTQGNGTYSAATQATYAPASSKFDIIKQANGIWLNAGWATHNSDAAMAFGGYGFLTYIHEIGHSLILSHPGIYNGTADYDKDANFIQDNRGDTIMSYFDAVKGGYDHGGLYAQTPMLYDVLAAQQYFGADTTTRTGNTTYGFNSNAGRIVYDFNTNTRPILTIWDAGGTDTLDLSGFTNNQVISMIAGTYSDIAGFTHNIAIAYGANIENLVGGSGIDRVTGNALNNRIEGKAGNDVIDGGGGTDTAVYGAARSQFTISTNAGVTTVVHNGGNLGTDTLTNIEKLQFTDQTVTLNGAAQVVISATGASIAEGNSGTTTLSFTVTLNQASTSTVSANYAVNSGTASSPSDYTAISGTVTFAAGQTSKTINITVKGDTVHELDETVNLVLTNASNATFSSRGPTLTVSGTIRNDDAAAIADDFPASTATSGRIGAGDTIHGSLETTSDSDWFATDLVAGHTYTATIPAFVNLGNATAELTFRNAAGTAQVTSSSGTLSFTPTTSGKYFIDVSSPAGLAQALDGYNLSLVDAGRAAPKYNLSIADISVAEDGGSATVTIQSDSVVNGGSVSFNVSTASGTATSGADFTAVTKTVTFGNTASVTVDIPIINDAAVESNESFTVNITNIQGAQAAGGGTSMSSTVTIIDNDAAGDDYGNTTATAGVASVGTTHGELETNGDSDWLKIDVQAGNTYTFDVRGNSSSGGTLNDPSLVLRDATGAEVDSDDDSGSGLDSSLKFIALENKTYYLDIQSYNNSFSGTYSVDITKNSLGELSVEGGNTLATATPISADFTIYQTLNFPASDTNDYYGIAVNTPIDFYLSLTALTADLDIFVYNASGTEVARSENVGDLDEDIKVHLSTAGNYYIQVKGFSSSVSPYFLQGAAIVDTTRSLETSASQITLGADKAAAFLTGSSNESITGSGNNDWLVGNIGDNAISGNSGDDFIGGGAGDDNISGGPGDDYLVGGLGDDVFSGEPGSDSYLGENGFDAIDLSRSTVGININLANTAGQVISTDFGTDFLSGIEGVLGSHFNDNATGASSDDFFDMLEGNDTVDAAGGNDFLRGGKGNDVLNGGAGSDSALYTDATAGVTVSLATTSAQAVGGGRGSDTLSNIENLIGSNFADQLTGNSLTNLLLGGAGNDNLDGGAGVDVLAGGDGDDRLDGGSTNATEVDILYGGVGNDTYIVNSTDANIDVVFEGGTVPGGATDVDTIISEGAFFWDFYNTGEILTIDASAGAGTTMVSGNANSTMNGNDFGNTLLTYGGSNEINPGRGIDTIGMNLYGLAGSFNGVNTVKLKAGDDTNYIYDFESLTDKVDTSGYGRFTDGAQMLANVSDTGWGSFIWMGAHEGQNEYVAFVGLHKADLDAGDFIT